MGWLRKKAKQIGKAIKKIGKGIKKVLGKIAKPFAKLGIVGQIGLGFLMPWAASSIFKGFGTLASTMAGSSNLFMKAAGTVMKGIHWGATKIQGAFNTVTDAIKGGFENLTGKAKEFFGIDADASDLLKNTPDIKEVDLSQTPYDKAVKDAVTSQTVEGQLAQTIPDALADKTAEKVAEKTLLEKVKEKGKEAILGIPSKITTGVVSGIQEGVAASIAQPDVEYAADVADFLSANAYQGYTTYNEVDFTKLNQYNDQVGSQAGLYGGPIHTVSFSNDASINLSSVDNYIQGLTQGRY
tara:strand:+ start:954 stop:1844 length:891 start_codon:yes stop_codon:yes gene_type:complete